jgi:metallophosphoesterase (TIGR00282 family)
VRALRILMLGDIVGRPGRQACYARVPVWRREMTLDAVIANGENASGGNGLSVKNAGELLDCGIDLITGGNHIWKQRDYPELFQTYANVLRPANYPDETPGKGWGTIQVADGVRVAVLNIQGRVFMDPIDCPFRAADRLLPEIQNETQLAIVDFHAEATSERVAMGLYLDGRVSAMFGSHTHVPSADTRILPGGTAYQTDLGMVGPRSGVLGVETGAILKRFLTGLPVRFQVAKGPVICHGVVLTLDPATGRALDIERFEELFDPGGERFFNG